MSASEIAVNASGQASPRTGFSYDPSLRGYDASFWKTISGTPSVASNAIRLTSAAIASYTQFKYGIVQFIVTVPTTPSAGEAKKIGLLLPAAPTLASAYFEIAGSIFKVVSHDDLGNAQSTTITWSAYETVATTYEIEWEKSYVIFKINGVVVATHQTRVGTMALPLYLINSDADNTDTTCVIIKETAQYV